MENNHFINNTFQELNDANYNPISGYENYPVMTLEESVKKLISLVPKLEDYVKTAKKECKQDSTLLTQDESASIYLYSMPIPFFDCLNRTLRERKREALKPWFAFLKLFLNALEKLPSTNATVWRGVAGDVGFVFADDQKQIWWSINSCSKNLAIVERYLGTTGTVFAIDTIYGRDISTYSTFPEEKEIILMPGTRVSSKCQSLNFHNQFFLFHLKEEKLVANVILFIIQNNHLFYILVNRN